MTVDRDGHDAVENLLHQLPQEQASPHFKTELMNRIAAEERTAFRQWAWPLLAGMALTLIFLGVTMPRKSQTRVEERPVLSQSDQEYNQIQARYLELKQEMANLRKVPFEVQAVQVGTSGNETLLIDLETLRAAQARYVQSQTL